MKRYCYLLFMMLFAAYWIATIFFILPENPINLGVYKFQGTFDRNLFQRWAFFAPPPNYNDRIYISFHFKKNNAIEIYEILEPIVTAKQKNAPFNNRDQVMDYIFSATIGYIEGNIRTFQDLYKYENADSLAKLSDSLISKHVVKLIEQTNDFMTLKSYAKAMAKDNNINTEEVLFQIRITKLMIPQFADRFNKSKNEERITFQSDLLPF